MKSIFLMQYFNTALIILLYNANFKYTFLNSLKLEQQYPDFTTGWYREVGSIIVRTMQIQALMPLINFILDYIVIYIKRKLDSGFCSCFNKEKKATKKTTIQQYLHLYSGPDIAINYRYSIILNMVFVTFTHGVALPILFPLCFIGMSIIYILESLLLAHFYK